MSLTPQEQELVQQAAYRKWEQAGCPCGEDLRFWLEAEQEVLAASVDFDDAVQEASEESFPASDPPAGAVTSVGARVPAPHASAAAPSRKARRR